MYFYGKLRNIYFLKKKKKKKKKKALYIFKYSLLNNLNNLNI